MTSSLFARVLLFALSRVSLCFSLGLASYEKTMNVAIEHTLLFHIFAHFFSFLVVIHMFFFQCHVIVQNDMFQIWIVIYLAGLSLSYLPESGQSALAS